MIDSIKILVGITEEAIEGVTHLTEACNSYDGTDLTFDLSERNKEKPHDFFYYKENQLIGYLGLYSHYTKGVINLKGIVHPDYRRTGVFSALFEKAKDYCKQNGYTDMVFINESTSESGKAFALSKGAGFKYSIYDMELDISSYKKYELNNEELTIRPAENSDIDGIVALGMEGFGTTDEEERPIIESSIKDDSKDMYTVTLGNHIVGTGTAIKRDDAAIVCGLVVEKLHRGKGIGRKMLTEIVSILLDKDYKKITLSVDVENINALSLYKDCGFRTVNAVDYYGVKI